MKGKLIITKSKKGKFNGKIEYTKKNGKPGILIITANIFENDDLNGKNCVFLTDNGKLIKLTVDDKQIYPKAGTKILAGKKKATETDFDELFDITESCLPIDTKQAINKEIDNYALKINKGAYFDEKKEKFIFFESNKKGKSKFILPYFGNIKFEDFKSKYNKLNYDKKEITLKLSWRLTIGLGGESVYETSITLHHIYGIPYIPASAVKGVVRSYIIQELYAQNNIPEEEKEYPFVNAEYRAYQDENFCYIFGCPADFDKVIFENGKPKTKIVNGKEENTKPKTALAEIWNDRNKKFTGHIGKITFFDAFPTEEPNIEPDIMNVHYKDYYNDTSGNVPPTDYQSPNPIPFLTVKDTKFQFVIGSKKEKLDSFEINGKTIDWWLIEALKNHGIGAKTAVGYGRLS